MTDCAFCKILSGDIPSSMIYRDGMCSAFLDIRPVNPGHVLIAPRYHAETLADLDPGTAGQLFRVAQRIDGALRASGIKCEGVNIYLSDGEVAGQEVAHVHLHVIPRFEGDGFGLRWGPEYGKQPPREELDDIAMRIKSALLP